MAISVSTTVPDAEYYTVRIGLNETMFVEATGETDEDSLADVLQAAAKQVNSNIIVAEANGGQLTVNGQVFVLRNGQTHLVQDVTLERAQAGDTIVAAPRQSNG